MRSVLVIVLTLFWQSIAADTQLAAPDSAGRICIASVEAPNDKPKSLHNPGGGNPNVTYAVRVADQPPITISRESGVWLEGLKLDSKLPVIIYEDGERTASFHIQFSEEESSKCLFLNTLYLTWQVWNWERTGPWCDCATLASGD